MNEQNQSLEERLWETLQAAAGMPEQVNLAALLMLVDASIAKLPEPARLQLAGEALLRVSEIHARRSEMLITEWEEAYRDPIVEAGFFAELVRQTMAVDLSELMEPTPARKPRTQRAKSTEAEVGPIATSVDKAVVLAMVEQLEAEADHEEARQQQVLAISEDENVSRWVAAIEQVLAKRADAQMSFSELYQCLRMPWVEVWLGVLLGGFELEQAGKFYQSVIWVKPPVPVGKHAIG